MRIVTPLFIVLFLSLPTTGHAKLDKETKGQIAIILERAAKSGDHQVRAQALETLAATNPKQGRKLAVEALKEPQWTVRQVAIRVLMRAKNKVWIEAMTMEMMNPRRNVDLELMPILSNASDKDAVAVGHRLLRKPKATTKNRVIESYMKLGGKRMIAFCKPLLFDKDGALASGIQNVVLARKNADVLPLLALLVTKGNPDVQKRALEILRSFPKGSKVSFVKSLMKRGTPALRVEAAKVLALHGDRKAIPVLLPVLEQRDEAAVVSALEALVEVAGAREYGAMHKLYTHRDTSATVRGLIMEIHYRNKNPQLLPALKKFRQLDDIDTQALTVYYLGLLEKGRALPSLHQDMTHGNEKVRIAAIKAVGQIGSRDSIGHLSRAMDNARSREARIEVAKALAHIKDKDVIPVVTFLISDRVPEVARWAIVALTRAQHKDAVSSLRSAMRARDLETRAQALEAIMRLDQAAGIAEFRAAMGWITAARLEALASLLKADFAPYLDMMLTSSKPVIWQTALGMLKKNPAQEKKLLVNALDRTRNVALKMAIYEQLAQRHGKNEYDRIAKLMDSRNIKMRTSGMELLGKLGDKKAAEPLKKALFDQNEKIRLSATVALLRLYRKIR